MDELTLFGLLLPLTIAGTELVKQIKFPKRFIPLVVLALGVLFAFLTAPEAYAVNIVIVFGLVAGFTSMGLWSGTKKLVFNK